MSVYGLNVGEIVLVTVGSWGDLFPMAGLGVELDRRGHKVALATSPAWSGIAGHRRASFRHCPASSWHRRAPLGIATPGKPNIASTIWRTVHDHGTRTVFFDSATSPTVFWLPLADLEFAAGSPVRRLPLADGQTYSGAATDALIEAEPFTFLEAKPE